MSDQADQLRKLVRDTVQQHPSLQPGVPLVVLSGGKGGVGVSTVATELAHELASLGKRSVLVDANPLQPDIATQLGLEVRGCLADVLDGNRTAVEVLQPLGESMQLLPGRWAPERPPELGHEAVRRLLTELRALHAQADVVILDAGSGMSPWVSQLWKSAQQILLVSTHESVAVMDSYAAVKLSPWGDVDGKVRLVINQCDEPQAAKSIGRRFEATCRRFLGIHIAPPIALPSHPDIVATVTQRNEEQAERDFRQSIRLLAAEVMSTSLAFAGTTSLGSAMRGAASLEYTNSTSAQRNATADTPSGGLLPPQPEMAHRAPPKENHYLPEKSLQNEK